MFQFPWYASNELCIHSQVTAHYGSWVSPFGNLRINVHLQLPEALSRFVASFIGSWRLGILRAHLLA